MNRKDFLLKMGIGAAVTVCAACLGSCKQQDSVPAAPANVDFTLDVTDPANNGLTNTGLNKNGIITVKTGNGNYVAVSAACTHQGSIVQYDRGNNRFVCNPTGHCSRQMEVSFRVRQPKLLLNITPP